MPENFNPSACTITKALIKTFDGSEQRDISVNFIGAFEINQSMDMVAYDGYISVLDTSGILENLPIRGEETLELEVISHDLDTKIRIRAVIHAVTEVQPTSSGNGLSYKLHFISDSSFKASTLFVTSAHKSSISEIARKLFEDNYASLNGGVTTDPKDIRRTLPYQTYRYPLQNQYSERNLYIQNAPGIQNLIIPRLMSSEAMLFIASRGYSAETPSQTYRFFETLEDFYFCTDEYFLKNVRPQDELQLYYSPVADFTPQAREQQINRIDTMRIISRGINSSDDMYSGSYKSEVTELDFIRRVKSTIKFNYDDANFADMTGSKKSGSQRNQPHTQEYKDQIFSYNNSKKMMIFRNYARPGDVLPNSLNNDLHLSEIAQNRVSYYHHLNKVVISAGLKGRLDIRPGQVINLIIKKFSGVESNVEENQISGRYLVKSTTHTMNEGVLSTGLILVKFDWTVTMNDRRQENEEIPTQGFI